LVQLLAVLHLLLLQCLLLGHNLHSQNIIATQQ
jgi:hypothetical protein